MKIQKLFLPEGDSEAVGIHRQYPIEEASWVWGPEGEGCPPVFAKLSLEFTIAEDESALRFHVSADQRYELFLDGNLVSRGPEVGDRQHWSFSSYEVSLKAGSHRLEAKVWSLGEHAPEAHHTYRPGFVFAAAGEYASQLNTGLAPWKWERLEGIRLTQERNMPGTHLVGSASITEESSVEGMGANPSDAIVTEDALQDWAWEWGLRYSDRCYLPARLPDQQGERFSGGRVRAILHEKVGEPGQFVSMPSQALEDPEISSWNQLLQAGVPRTVPAFSERAILWDMDYYLCGYPVLRGRGGAGARIDFEWAESLYDEKEPRSGERDTRKGDRSAVAGKYFFGFGDTVHPAGGKSFCWRNYWWRSGRYILLRVRTAEEPLELTDVCIEKTGIPLDFEGSVRIDQDWGERLFSICQSGLENCAHETFVDCPYYEQLMYLGDTRLQALCLYATNRDSRLQKRALELADWSRAALGGAWPTARYPSRMATSIPTFGLIWVAMLRDHLDWRGDEEFLRTKLGAVRQLLERFADYIDSRDIFQGVPCWQFVDWTPAWRAGVPPGATTQGSSVVNLLFLLALDHARHLESVLGDKRVGERYEELRNRVRNGVRQQFWNEERGLLADDCDHRSFSEHAQVLGILTDCLEDPQKVAVMEALKSPNDLHPTTVYFRHYLFDAAFQVGASSMYFEGLGDWEKMLKSGAKTPWERPEPSRSDCHAWGSHPWFWAFVGVAGIRPDAPGFGSVRIAPQPGPRREIVAEMPHPNGFIRVQLCFEGSACEGSVELPDGVTGVFEWRGCEIDLKDGSNSIGLD